MLITKIFNVESAHIVRNCTSKRCAHSIHGHSAKIEVTFEATQLDNAQMVMDFGLMSNEIKKFIDSMDHCYLLCKYDNPEFKEFIKKSCDRWIELPFNPSAEMLSMFVMWGVSSILQEMIFNNGEKPISVYSVKYHETASGSATCFMEDMMSIWNNLEGIDDETPFIRFSRQVMTEWDSPAMVEFFTTWAKEDWEMKMFINPIVKQQIDLKNK